MHKNKYDIVNINNRHKIIQIKFYIGKEMEKSPSKIDNKGRDRADLFNSEYFNCLICLEFVVEPVQCVSFYYL